MGASTKGLIPEKIQKPYLAFLEKHKITSAEIPQFLKWLRFYLDFCSKCSHPVSSHDSWLLFKTKLAQKNQTEKQVEQAQKAIQLFSQLIESLKNNKTNTHQKIDKNKPVYKKLKEPGLSKNQSWEKDLELLKNEISIRQYSRKTLNAYIRWARLFQAFLKSKSPDLIDSKDAKAFITHLAVQRQVAVSTQNLAFNALLFCFQHVLQIEFGDFKDIPRAKKTKQVPSVLSRKEIDAIIDVYDSTKPCSCTS